MTSPRAQPPTLSWRSIGVLVALVALGAAAGALLFDRAAAPQERAVTVTAKQYAFDPPIIRANVGDRLRLKLVSLDVTHGFYLEGHDLDAEILPQQAKARVRRPSTGAPPVEQEEVVVVADKPGKFRYRCSHTCGSLHPFMSGELVVAPNRLLHGGLGACVGLLVGFALVATMGRAPREESPHAV